VTPSITPGLPDLPIAKDAAIADADVCFVNTGRVDDDGVRDDEVGAILVAARAPAIGPCRPMTLPPPNFASSPVGRRVVLDLDNEIGVGAAMRSPDSRP